MNEGIIELDDGNPYGFTSDKFDGYLWQLDGAVVISFIVSKQPGHGNFRALVEAILASGQSVHVPTPFPQMHRILAKHENGFRQTWVWDDVFDEEVELWIKP